MLGRSHDRGLCPCLLQPKERNANFVGDWLAAQPRLHNHVDPPSVQKHRSRNRERGRKPAQYITRRAVNGNRQTGRYERDDRGMEKPDGAFSATSA